MALQSPTERALASLTLLKPTAHFSRSWEMHAWVAASSTALQLYAAVATSFSMTEKALQVELASIPSSSSLQQEASEASEYVANRPVLVH
jgi:hypothetical protein